jgi:methylated-DNA-[protein]-cysteine S-methyltransferase
MNARSMNLSAPYSAKLATPFCVLGIRCVEGRLRGIDFLPLGEQASPARDAFARQVCEQLTAYLRDPDFIFDLPLELAGSAHQAKVWKVMTEIPRGEVTTYGEIAALIGSSPRAVGQACGSNPIPIIIPCHRVVSKNGAGGFMHQSGGDALTIKHWLLRHEQAEA